jgi:hypothetical protein
MTASAHSLPFKCIKLISTYLDQGDFTHATLFLGSLEHYLVQVCSLLGWDQLRCTPPVLPPQPTLPVTPTTLDTFFSLWLVQKPPSESPTIRLPNYNHPHQNRLRWVSPPLHQATIGEEPGPVNNAIEYSIFVGDLGGDVTKTP